MDDLIKLLKAKQDSKYKEFISKLTPSVSIDYFIGVRVPEIRKIASSVNEETRHQFIESLPHHYYEEYLLHSFMLQKEKDFDYIMKQLELFLPYVDNWAVCDTFRPKIFKKHLKELFQYIQKWIKSDKTYTVRFAIGMLEAYYLEEAFDPKYLMMVSNVKSEEYYIKIMVAWYFSTALAKQYDAAIKYIEDKKLEKWIHNKAIQKAIESLRVDLNHKDYLNKLRY